MCSYEEDRALWKPSLEALVAAGTLSVFTSYNQLEAQGDAAAWKAAGGVVVQGPKENPYRSVSSEETRTARAAGNGGDSKSVHVLLVYCQS